MLLLPDTLTSATACATPPTRTSNVNPDVEVAGLTRRDRTDEIAVHRAGLRASEPRPREGIPHLRNCYAGWYSNRSRGARRRMDNAPAAVETREVDVREAARVRSTWARLIHKVYEVDPLECSRCKGPMRVIALIDDKAVIRKILSHLGLWVPQIAAGRGPGPPAPDPPRPAAQILTYHPVPDIA